MIKFFQKIRQKLIKEKKASKYFIYALGEILLVMIGILLALQVNNWNEQRKDSAFELELLQSFRDGLQQDLADIDFNIRQHNRGIAAGDEILLYMEEDRPYNLDTIAKLFSDFMTPARFVYSTSAFETLKSSGITNIKNKSLRNEIVGVYDSQYKFFIAWETSHLAENERGYTEIFSSRFEDSYSYNFQRQDFPGRLMPLDFKSLKSDQEFLYYMKSFKNRSIVLIDFHYANLRSRVVNLLADIEKEITENQGI